jgi:hypothetical protein
MNPDLPTHLVELLFEVSGLVRDLAVYGEHLRLVFGHEPAQQLVWCSPDAPRIALGESVRGGAIGISP